MVRRIIVTSGLTVLTFCAAASVVSARQRPAHGAVPTVQTIRATTPIVVDGRLDDEVWVRATPATEFTQREPDEGKPATEATELRIAYDDARAVRRRPHEGSRAAADCAGSSRAAIRTPRRTPSRSCSIPITTI